MLLKRIVATAILCAIYSLVLIGGFFTEIMDIIFCAVPATAVIVTLIFYFISTKYLKIFYNNGGLITAILVFLIINLTFCLFGAADKFWGLLLAVVLSSAYASIGLAAFVIIQICRYIKRGMQGDGGCQQAAEDLSSDEEKDITGENELTNGSEPYKKIICKK